MSEKEGQGVSGSAATTAKLGKIRDRIDAIDTQILQLLSDRANCAEEVAVTKRDAGETDIKFYRPEREAI